MVSAYLLLATAAFSGHVGAFTTSPTGVKISRRTGRGTAAPLASLAPLAPFHLSPSYSSTSSISTTNNVLSSHPSLSDSNSALFVASNDGREQNGNIIDAQVIDKVPTTNTIKKTNIIQGVNPLLKRPWLKLQNWLQQNATTVTRSRHRVTSLLVAAVLAFSVLLTPLSDASAAPSGGRMGGSFGGSSRSSSSRSYSSPRSSSSSYGRGFSRGYSSGYYSRPSITVAPSYYPSSSYYYGPGGVTVMRRGPTFVDVFAYGILALVAYSAVSDFFGTDVDGDGDGGSVTSVLGPGVSVAQISVALNVPDRDDPSSVLKFLNRLSRTARTDSRVGVSNLVSQVAIELLRQRRSAFAAGSKYKHYRNANQANRDFSSAAIQERSKFEREDVSNYGGVDYGTVGGVNSSSSSSIQFSPKATAVVVTILLSIDGDSTKIPTINSITDLERALTQIASDVKVDGCLRAAEVLWTPQAEGDALTERDVIADYPELRNV